MDKYLLEILKEVNTIIIPGLGALTITDATSGEIMFMPYLKHDDGELSKYIAEKEGMEENDAKNLIAKYVREILNTLDKGETYDMFKFGSFFKDDAGDIQFKNWDSLDKDIQNVNPEQHETVEATVPVEDNTTEEQQPEEEVVEETEEKVPEIKEAEAEKTEEVVSNEKENIEEIPPIIPIESKNDEITTESVVKEEKTAPKEEEKQFNILEQEERAATQAKLDALKAKKEEKHKKKRGAMFYVLIVFAVLIISASGYIMYDFDTAKEYLPFLASNSEEVDRESELEKMKELLGKENEATNESNDTIAETTVDQVQPEESVVEEEYIPEEIVVEKEPEPVVEEKIPEVKNIPAPVSGGTYHIIAGTFSSSENAEKYISNLNAQGISGSVVEESGMYQVSLGSYNSRQEAKNALANMNISIKARVHKVD